MDGAGRVGLGGQGTRNRRGRPFIHGPHESDREGVAVGKTLLGATRLETGAMVETGYDAALQVYYGRGRLLFLDDAAAGETGLRVARHVRASATKVRPRVP